MDSRQSQFNELLKTLATPATDLEIINPDVLAKVEKLDQHPQAMFPVPPPLLNPNPTPKAVKRQILDKTKGFRQPTRLMSLSVPDDSVHESSSSSSEEGNLSSWIQAVAMSEPIKSDTYFSPEDEFPSERSNTPKRRKSLTPTRVTPSKSQIPRRLKNTPVKPLSYFMRGDDEDTVIEGTLGKFYHVSDIMQKHFNGDKSVDREEVLSQLAMWKQDCWAHLIDPPTWLEVGHFAVCLTGQMSNPEKRKLLLEASRNLQVARLTHVDASISNIVAEAKTLFPSKLTSEGPILEMSSAIDSMGDATSSLRDHAQQMGDVILGLQQLMQETQNHVEGMVSSHAAQFNSAMHQMTAVLKDLTNKGIKETGSVMKGESTASSILMPSASQSYLPSIVSDSGSYSAPQPSQRRERRKPAKIGW